MFGLENISTHRNATRASLHHKKLKNFFNNNNKETKGYLPYGPFTLAILSAISSAILRRFQIVRVNYWRFRGDLNFHG